MFSAMHSCGHVSLWRTPRTCPDVGDELTCAYCGKAVRVTAVLGPWRVRCLDCRRVDGHATLTRTVMRTAIKHAQEWTTHRVRVWQFGDADSVRILSANNVGAQSALFSDAPF